MRQFLIGIIFFTTILTIHAQKGLPESAIKLARVKYSGGSDWYNDQSSEVNLLNYVKRNTNINVNPTYEFVELASKRIFEYPLLFLTGHGNMKLTDREVKNLRAYLEGGGFLYIDDDYGLDKYLRQEMKKVFPDSKFTELPFSHPIYNCHFDFSDGPPKIHEHDDKKPKGFGLFREGRMVIFYTYESNPADGWADAKVHGDSEEKREKALQFGTNIVVWALTN